MAESGIYEIVNLVNGKRYVGSAVDLRRRKTDHFKNLRGGRHCNRHLQSSWHKHGESRFRFQVLFRCEPCDLIAHEQRLLDSLRPEYNICRTAGSCLGVKRSPESIAKRVAKFPKSFGPETRRKVGEASRRSWANPRFRAKRAKSHAEAMLRADVRAKKSEASKRVWQDQEKRARIIASRSGLHNGATDHSVYTLVHSDGRKVTGIQLELRPLTGISPACLTQLLKGNQQTSKGWNLASPQEAVPCSIGHIHSSK